METVIHVHGDDSVQADATLDPQAPSLVRDGDRIVGINIPGSQQPPRGVLKDDGPIGTSVRTVKTSPKEKPFDHKAWASAAWTALARSLGRSPLRLASYSVEKKIFIDRYTKRSEEGTAMKWLKFHTSYIFAYSVGQTELPKPPFPTGEEGELTTVTDDFGRCKLRVGIIGGNLGRTIRALMSRGRSGNWACRRCCYDIMMSKIGMPPANADFVDGALNDHKAAMSKSIAPENRSSYDHFVLARVKEEIGHICAQVFGNKEFSHIDAIPSMRASFENGIGNGGGLAHLISGFHEFTGSRPLPTEPVLFGMYEDEGVVREIRFIDGDLTVTDFQRYVDYLWLHRVAEPLYAQPCPILEPLKVRIITKGQAAEYYRAIELQKFMHSTLKKWPIFEYIGHPIDDQSWAECFGSLEDLSEDEFYVSGDYKGATDNLDPSLSLHAWECIANYAQVRWCGEVKNIIDTPYYLLGRKALCGHMLKYSTSLDQALNCMISLMKDEEPDPMDKSFVDQTWGQLMGSPMSFPILCIVNAAASLVSLNQTFSSDFPMKVNGDDIAFVATAETYSCWKEVTAICGLEFSLGKNYTSREFIIMNSELRRPPKSNERRFRMCVGRTIGNPESSFDPDLMEMTYNRRTKTLSLPVLSKEDYQRLSEDPWRTEISWESVPVPWRLEGFLNQSIIYHTIKKGIDAGKEKDIYWTDFESLSHEAINGIPEKSQWKVLSLFLEAHKEHLSEVPCLSNIWFPVALGGCGMAIPAGRSLTDMVRNYDPKILERQQRLAAYLACNPKVRLQGLHRSKRLVGELGELIMDTMALSDQQCKPKLITKPLLREQKTMLGGKTLLGYLIRGLGIGQSDLDDLVEQAKEKARKEVAPKGKSVGGENPSEKRSRPKKPTAADLHRKEVRHLTFKFMNMARKSLHTSLNPMELRNIVGYQEHLTYASRISIMRDPATYRHIDVRRYGPVIKSNHAVIQYRIVKAGGV